MQRQRARHPDKRQGNDDMIILVLLVAGLVGVRIMVIISSCNGMMEEIERARRFYTGTTTAKVVKVEEERFGRERAYYWPVFHYEIDGVEYEKKAWLFTDQYWWYQKGWEYEIRYNISNPEEFMLVDDQGSYDRAQHIVTEHIIIAVVIGVSIIFAIPLGLSGAKL